MARAILYGTPVAPGIAIGKVVFTHQQATIAENFVTPENIDSEVARLTDAAATVLADLAKTKASLTDEMKEHKEIINTHMMICQDPRLIKDTEEHIRTQRMCAPWALDKTIKALCAAFANIDDPYLRDRAQDIRNVGMRLQCQLTGKIYTPKGSGGPSVHVAEDLSPTDALELPIEHILALLMAEGGPTSHTAILARSLRIPAVVGISGITKAVREGDFVIVDALKGCVYIDPDDQEIAFFAQRQEEYVSWEWNVRRSAGLAAETIDGVRVTVQANLEHPNEVAGILDCGAEGVGLYRTEYAYLRTRNLPDETQLYQEYTQVAQQLYPQRVVFRTLDVGSDKMLHLPAMLNEANPALGLRGIRFCLRHQNLFRTQIRALLRAGVTGNVALMLPMISGLEELQYTRRIIAEVEHSLASQGIVYADNIPIGIMIEVPSTIFIADALARECDFFSIGTNDLVHYLLAIDRGNKHVGYLHRPLHPSIMRSLKWIVDCAHREGISVSVCGELASDPYFLALLLGMGIDAISATPQSIPGIKHLLRQCHAGQCMNMMRAVLMSTDVTAANRIVTETLALHLKDNLAFHTSLIHSDANG